MSSTAKAIAIAALVAAPVAALSMEASNQEPAPAAERGWLETLLPTLSLLHGAG